MAIIGEDSYYRLRGPDNRFTRKNRALPSPHLCRGRPSSSSPQRAPTPSPPLLLHFSSCIAMWPRTALHYAICHTVGSHTGQHVEGAQFPSFETVRTYRKPCELDPHDDIFVLWIIIRSCVHVARNLTSSTRTLFDSIGVRESIFGNTGILDVYIFLWIEKESIPEFGNN